MKTILIIDDEKPLLENISDMLETSGFNVLMASDGASGIQLAMKNTPDLIVCDISMPDIDGYEVYTTLEQIPYTKNIPFIFLTAKTQVSDLRTGMQLGADDYITKPFRFVDLIASIKKRLEKYEMVKNSSENKFLALAQTPFSGVFLYHHGEFMFVNKKFIEFSGFSIDDIQQNNLTFFIDSSNESEKIHRIEQCLKGNQDNLQFHLTITTKEGKPQQVDFFLKSVKIKGKNGVLGIFSPLNQKNISDPPEDFKQVIELLVDDKNQANQLLEIAQQYKIEKQKKNKKVDLTKREREVLELICQGLTNQEIAEKLYISNRTVDNHRRNLLLKTNSKNTARLVAFAYQNEFVNS